MSEKKWTDALSCGTFEINIQNTSFRTWAKLLAEISGFHDDGPRVAGRDTVKSGTRLQTYRRNIAPQPSGAIRPLPALQKTHFCAHCPLVLSHSAFSRATAGHPPSDDSLLSHFVSAATSFLWFFSTLNMTAGIPPKRWYTCQTTGQDCRLNQQTSSFTLHFNPWPEGKDLEHGRSPCFLRTQRSNACRRSCVIPLQEHASFWNVVLFW